MKSRLVIGAACFMLGAAALALAQGSGALRPEQFIAMSWNWGAGQGVTPVALTDGSSIPVDVSLSNGFTLTLTGNNHTLANPSNVTGKAFSVAISTGTGFTGFDTASNYKFGTGVKPGWSTAAGKKDILSCWADTSSTVNCSAIIDVR
jgi:hypothetical protein